MCVIYSTYICSKHTHRQIHREFHKLTITKTTIEITIDYTNKVNAPKSYDNIYIYFYGKSIDFLIKTCELYIQLIFTYN